jgi:uncharacterized protein (TIGR02145 family)
MKKLFAFLAILAMTLGVVAQAPQKMSYQCVVRDPGGVLVTNQSIGIRISILQGSATGEAIYVETQTPTTNANGLISIEIGGGNVLGRPLASIDWSMSIYFIKTEIDPFGGTNYVINVSSQLLSVPYALYSKTSGNIGNVTFSFTGDTMFLGKNKIIIPGVSEANRLEDIDGNVYKTVLIGDQVWMAENLKTTRFNDGTIIPKVTEPTAWSTMTSPGYCWYDNNEANYKNIYGAIYNLFTFEDNLPPPHIPTKIKNICPIGWHIPDRFEWRTLMLTLDPGCYNIEPIYCMSCWSLYGGAKLKEAGTSHWVSPNDGATNESGFTALPGGIRYKFNGQFQGLGTMGTWWIKGNMVAMMRNVNSNVEAGIDGSAQTGHSIRCLKDN